MHRYLRNIAIMLGGLFLFALLVSVQGITQCAGADRYSCALLRFQKDKVAVGQPDYHLAFFGDSSLGNAVDARQLASLEQKPVINLALNGAMGLPVIYLQMKDVLAHRHIRNAVIMLSPEAYRHHYNRGASLYVSEAFRQPGLLFGISPRIAFANSLALFQMLFDADIQQSGLLRLLALPEPPADCPGCAEIDYVRQNGKRVSPESNDLGLWKGPYKDYDPFLQRIADLCRQNNVNCLYMHGPIMREVLDKNPDYIAAVDKHLAKVGLPVVAAEPIVIPDSDVGNAINHVRPDLRPAYTAMVFDAVKPFLR
jgi:hypothetical protein